MALVTLAVASVSKAGSIYSTGTSLQGIRDFREVMPGILYRGGANNGRNSLNSNQLQALCQNGIGTSIYLYSTGFSGPTNVSCAQGTTSYQHLGYQGQDLRAIHRMIYNSIKSDQKPVFIHCWYGIHATGLVAATALMQFCNATPSQAVAYWKVGIAPSLQYPKVMQAVQSFQPDPSLELTRSEQSRYCPNMN